MRKICLIAGCLLFSTTVLSAPIPGHDHFSEWGDFQGMFEKIYKDTRELDVTAICERVLEWPDFLNEEGELIFSLEDCEEFAYTENLSNFVNTHSGSKTTIDRWIEVFRVKYAFEKQLWQFEHDMQRQLALAYIWNDGDGGKNDANEQPEPQERTSPVDLVFRWNEIDNILFGELAEYPEFAAFTESTDDIFDSWEGEPTEDPWLNQQEEVFTYDPLRNYSEREKSITGGYEELARMFEEKLNTYSLIAGKMTTQTFDAPFTGYFVPVGLGMHVDGAVSPSVSPDIPTQLGVLEKSPMKEFDGLFPLFFRQQSTLELRGESFTSSSRRISASLHEAFSTMVDKMNTDLTEKVAVLLRDISETREKDEGLTNLVPLQKFNTTLDVWIDILNLWKIVNEKFLTHPVY